MNTQRHIVRRTLGGLDDTDLQSFAGALLSYLQQNGCTQDPIPACADFQNAFNNAGGSPALTVDGEYGPCTAAALQASLNAGPLQPPQAAPASCFPGVCVNGSYVGPSPAPAPAPTPAAAAFDFKPWVVGGVGLLVGGLLGHAIAR